MNSQISRRHFLAAAAMTSAAAAVAACGVSGGSPSAGTAAPSEGNVPGGSVPPPDSVKLLYMHSRDDGQPAGRDAVNAMVDKFMDTNPGIEIEQRRFENIEYLNTILPTAFAGGQPPDIFMHVGFQRLFEYSEQMLDLTDSYNSGWKDRYVPGMEPAIAKDGTYYAVPWTLNGSNFLWYWTEPLADLGFDASDLATVDGWAAVNEASLAKDQQPFSFSGAGWNCFQWLQNFVDRRIGAAATTDLVLMQAGKWTDPEVVQAARDFKDFYDRGFLGKDSVAEEWSISLENFIAGRAWQAGWVDGISDNIKGYEEREMGGSRAPIDLVRFPEISGGKGSLRDWVFWSFCNAGTTGENDDAKIKFLDALGSAEYQAVGYAIQPRVPVAIGATKGIESHWTTEKLGQLYDEAAALIPVADLPITGDVADVFYNELPAMLSGLVSPEDAMANCQAAVEKGMSS